MTIAVSTQFNSSGRRACEWLLLFIFALIPFQRRFHGAIDSFSRSFSLPDFPLPQYFSTKLHVYLSDFLILALVLGILYFYRISWRTFFWEGPSKYLTLLSLASLLSVYFSITSSYTLSYFRWMEFTLLLLFFNSVRVLCERIHLRLFIQKLCWILVIVCTVECAFGILQYFTQGNLGLHFLGEKNLWHFPFPNPDQHRWLFDHFFKSGGGHPYLCRASGTFSHPNIFGGFILCSALATYFLFVQQLYKRKKALLFLCLLLQYFSLFIAFSRSAMIALALSSIIWCVLQFRNKDSSSQAFRRCLKMIGIMGISSLLCISLFYSQLTARGGILNYNAMSQYADSERIQYMKIALEMVKEHPFIGIGLKNFQLYLDSFQGSMPGHFFFAKVHNIYLLMAAETGLIGGGLFLVFLLAIVRRGWRVRENLQIKAFLFSLFIGLLFIGQCDFYLLDSPQGSLLFFGIAGLLSALSQRAPFFLQQSEK